jgi:hypothetical protein
MLSVDILTTRKDGAVKKPLPQTLGEFLYSEMRRRRMGVNEFSRLVGVGHSMISNHISDEPPTPNMKFLRQLSKGTSMPLVDLLAIAFPEVREELKVDPAADMLARRIMQFENHTRDALIRVIESFEQSSNNH